MMRSLTLIGMTLVIPLSAAGQSCTGTVPANMNLGTYTGVLSTSGVVTNTATCTRGLVYNLTLDAGQSSGASVTTRKMTGPSSATLGYALYRDSAMTLNWGKTAGTDTYRNTGNSRTQPYSIYPSLAGGQNVAPGTYSDTITIGVVDPPGNPITTTFSVTAVVQAACMISASSLAFGNYYSGAADNSTSVLSVTCTNTTTYSVSLNAGIAAGATVSKRSMTGPVAALLGYTLSRNSTHTLNWGTTIGTDTVAGTGNGTIQSLIVYGQIPAAQMSRPGNYTDTITATITY